MNSTDALDRRIVMMTQSGLPLCERPYVEVAETLGVSVDLVLARLAHMLESGAIRRIGAVPNHYKLGFTANGMSVWDIDDREIEGVGEQIGALEFVSHAYQRPRCLPLWPYNLFAMVHGRSREEVLAKVDTIKNLVGSTRRQHDVLFSVRILKKTGLRIGDR